MLRGNLREEVAKAVVCNHTTEADTNHPMVKFQIEK